MVTIKLPVAPPLDLLAGVHTAGPQTPDELSRRWPGATLTRVFLGNKHRPDRTFDPEEADLADELLDAGRAAWDTGWLPVVSFKLRPAEVLAGAWDTHLLDAGRRLAAEEAMIVIPWHEPEDDHATTVAASEFVRAFNHIRAALKGRCPSLVVAYCAMAYQWRDGSPTTADPAIWRQIEADLYLCDVYSGKAFPGDAILPEHSGFARWKQEIVDAVPGRHWGVGERGILEGPDRAGTWLRERTWLLTHGRDCRFYLVWNSPGAEGDRRWVMPETEGSESEDLAAVRRLLASVGLPVGYLATDMPGVVVCRRTGQFVARALIDRHAAVLRRLLPF